MNVERRTCKFGEFLCGPAMQGQVKTRAFLKTALSASKQIGKNFRGPRCMWTWSEMWCQLRTNKLLLMRSPFWDYSWREGVTMGKTTHSAPKEAQIGKPGKRWKGRGDTPVSWFIFGCLFGRLVWAMGTEVHGQGRGAACAPQMPLL